MIDWRLMVVLCLTAGNRGGLEVTDGQMLAVLSAGHPISEVRITGLNQRGQVSVWRMPTGRSNTLALSANWWWKGSVTVEFKKDGRQELCRIDGVGQGSPIVFVEVLPAGGCRGDAQNSSFPQWRTALAKYTSSRWALWPSLARQQAIARLEQEAERLNQSPDGYTGLRKLLGLER